MRRITYLSNIFVRIEDFFVASFGLWIDSFCFWAVRPMKATKNSTQSSLSSLCFAIYPISPKIFSGYFTLYPDNMKYSSALTHFWAFYSVTSLNRSQLCQSVTGL